MSEFRYLPMDLVRHGPGTLDQLPVELARLGARRAFVVTSPSVVGCTDIVLRIRGLLGNALADVYADVRPHVPYGCLQAGIDRLRASGADIVVSVGGGSTVDAARALALAIGEDVEDVRGLEAFRARFSPPDTTDIPTTSGRALPIVAVPTTLSAAEFANAGAVTSETRNVKDLLIADELTPRSVILDPEVAVHTPIQLWSSTGMRALDHAIETIYSPRHGPVTDALSLDAIRRLAASLRAAQQKPADVGAREEGQIGAWLSYFGEMNLTLGLSHAIGHQIGAQFAVQHGLTSCIILPSVMRYLAPQVADRLALVASSLGVETSGLTTGDAAEAAAKATEALVAELGLPHRLRDIGVTERQFPALADAVLTDLVVAGSPRPIEAPEQVVEILAAAA